MKATIEKDILMEQISSPMNTQPFFLDKDLNKEKEINQTQKDLIFQNRRFLEESIQQLNFMKSVSKALVAGLDFNNIVSGLFKELKSFMSVDILSVHLQKMDSVCSRVLSSYPIDEKTVEQIKETVIKGYGRVSKRLVDIEALKHEFLYLPSQFKNTKNSNSNCSFGIKKLSYPSTLLLRVSGETVGLMNLYKLKGKFSSDQIRTIHMVVDQIGYVLSNAMEYKKVVELASRDSLTGILNRRVFNDILKRECQRAYRYTLPLSLILIDIDHFKKINDNYGHPAGDKVLSAFARVISGCIRETDVFARYGGEEFAIILPETDKKSAFLLAERIRESISNFSFKGGKNNIKVTASMGVTSFCDSAENCSSKEYSVEDLLSRADTALYKAKAEGRDKVCQAA